MNKDNYEGNELEPTRSVLVDIANAWMAHVALWIIPLFALTFFTTGVEKTYREFDIKLPTSTEWVISGRLMMLFPIAVLLWVIDIPVLFFLNRGTISKVLSILWSVLMIAIPILITIIAIYSLFMPLIMLTKELSR